MTNAAGDFQREHRRSCYRGNSGGYARRHCNQQHSFDCEFKSRKKYRLGGRTERFATSCAV